MLPDALLKGSSMIPVSLAQANARGSDFYLLADDIDGVGIATAALMAGVIIAQQLAAIAVLWKAGVLLAGRRIRREYIERLAIAQRLAREQGVARG